MSTIQSSLENAFRRLKESFNGLILLSRLVDRSLSANKLFLSQLIQMDADKTNFRKRISNDLLERLNRFHDFQASYAQQVHRHYASVKAQQEVAKAFLKVLWPVMQTISMSFKSGFSESKTSLQIVAALSPLMLSQPEETSFSSSEMCCLDKFLDFITFAFVKIGKSLTNHFNELEKKASFFVFNLLSGGHSGFKSGEGSSAWPRRSMTPEPLSASRANFTLGNDNFFGIDKRPADLQSSLKSEVQNHFRVSERFGNPEAKTCSIALLKTSKKSSTNKGSALKGSQIAGPVEALDLATPKDLMSTPSKTNRTDWASPFHFSFVNTVEVDKYGARLHPGENVSSSKFYQPNYRSFNDSYSAKCKSSEKVSNVLTAPRLISNAEPEVYGFNDLVSNSLAKPDAQNEATEDKTKTGAFQIRTPFYFGGNKKSPPKNLKPKPN